MSEEFQLVAGHVVLDFANTLDHRFTPARTIEMLPSFDRLVDFALQSQLIEEPSGRRLKSGTDMRNGESVLRRAIEFRETLDQLFRSVISHRPPRGGCLESFNGFVAQYRKQETFSWKSGELVRSYADVVNTADWLLWLLVDSAASLLTSIDLVSVRECHDQSCRWLFLDQSKNHSRRWCSMDLCGNRSKVRRFREQT